MDEQIKGIPDRAALAKDRKKARKVFSIVVILSVGLTAVQYLIYAGINI